MTAIIGKQALISRDSGGVGKETRSGTEKRCSHKFAKWSPWVVVSGQLQYFSCNKYFKRKKLDRLFNNIEKITPYYMKFL